MAQRRSAGPTQIGRPNADRPLQKKSPPSDHWGEIELQAAESRFSDFPGVSVTRLIERGRFAYCKRLYGVSSSVTGSSSGVSASGLGSSPGVSTPVVRLESGVSTLVVTFESAG